MGYLIKYIWKPENLKLSKDKNFLTNAKFDRLSKFIEGLFLSVLTFGVPFSCFKVQLEEEN